MKEDKQPGDTDRQKIQMTPEEFLWWVMEKRGFTEEQVRNDPTIQQIVREEANRRNDEVILRVMDELAKNTNPTRSKNSSLRTTIAAAAGVTGLRTSSTGAKRP